MPMLSYNAHKNQPMSKTATGIPGSQASDRPAVQDLGNLLLTLPVTHFSKNIIDCTVT